MKFFKLFTAKLTFANFLPFLLLAGLLAILAIALQPTPPPPASAIAPGDIYFQQTAAANLTSISRYQTAIAYNEYLTAEAEKPLPTPTVPFIPGNPNFRILSARGQLTYRAPGCDIKGDITLDDPPIKRYYTPNQSYWVSALIEPERGERWFCTEEDAQMNGWTKSRS